MSNRVLSLVRHYTYLKTLENIPFVKRTNAHYVCNAQTHIMYVTHTRTVCI